MTTASGVENGSLPAAEPAGRPRAGRWRISAAVGAVCVAVAVILVHAPACRGPFLFDDIFEIEKNTALATLWPPTVPMFGGRPFPKRPLPAYTFALDRAVHGLDTFGFRAVNVAIHLLNGLLAWWIGTALLRRPRIGWPATRERAVIGAGLATAAWLLHPLATQPVAYIYQRIELLGALAILATLACFLRSLSAPRPAGWQAAAVAACGLGMLCKETVVAAPLLVLLVDALAVQSPDGGAGRGFVSALRGRPALYAGLWGTIGIAAWVVWVQRDVYRELTAPAWTRWEYLATQPAAIGRYLTLAAFPVGQCFDYGWTPVANPALRVVGVAALAAAVGAALAAARRLPGPALAMTGFLALLAPTSSLIPVNDLFVEHRMYLPLFVLLLAAVGSLASLAERCEWHATRSGRVGVGAAAVAILALLAVVSAARVTVYRSLHAVWSDAAAKAPRNPRAQLWLGIALAELGRPEEAFAAFGRTIVLAPDRAESARAHAWRAAILGRAGRPAEAHAEAVRATKVNPREPLGWANLARAAAEMGRTGEAIAACRQALTLDPTLAPTARLRARLEAAEPPATGGGSAR